MKLYNYFQVGARPFNSTALNITWTPIPNEREKIRGKLIGHRIKYWRQDLNEITESQYLLSRSTDPHALIIGLQPNTYYWVRVMAYNSAGPGPESERFLERTFKLRPQKPPTAVQVNIFLLLAHGYDKLFLSNIKNNRYGPIWYP